MKLAAPVPPSRPRTLRSPHPNQIKVEFLYDEVTITPAKTPSIDKSDENLGSPWNDHLVKESPAAITAIKHTIGAAAGRKCKIVGESRRKRKVKDWDWEPALPEMVSEVTWSENEEFEGGHLGDPKPEKESEFVPELFDKHGRDGKRSNTKW